MVGLVTKYLGFFDTPVHLHLDGRELKGRMSKSSVFTACLGSGSQACDDAGGDEGDDEGDDSSCLFGTICLWVPTTHQ